jgi:hypothetical protein
MYLFVSTAKTQRFYASRNIRANDIRLWRSIIFFDVAAGVPPWGNGFGMGGTLA